MSLELLYPPGTAISTYKHGQRHNSQDDAIPQLFRDTMAVREEVFIDEQKCSLENEVDADDARSYHWVVYVSVAASKNSSANRNPQQDLSPALDRKDSADATAVRKPVGTLRLVPPPHQPHLAEEGFTPKPAYHEPYVKLTRLAVSKEYRGKYGLARQLLSECFKFLQDHGHQLSRPADPAKFEKLKLQGKSLGLEKGWNGLVLVHSQVQAVGFWERLGFVVDEGLGQWDEEGIMHVGMWRKVNLED